MRIEKIKGYLNIARKAGYLIIGGEMLENYNKKLFLVIYDTTSGNNTLKIIEKLKLKCVETYGINNLNDLVSIPNCKIVGIKNKNISDIVKSLINE